MKKLTQIVLVGHTKVRLIEGIKQFPTEQLILVLGDKPNLEGEAKVSEIAINIEAIFKSVMEIKRIYVDKEDIFQAALKLLQTIQDAIQNGYKVTINVSGSLRQMAIASYIAGLVSDTPIYSVIPRYDMHFQEVGIEELCSIPLIPMKELSSQPLQILHLLEKVNQIASIEDLINKIFSNSAKSQHNRLRAKVSYYLKDLEEQGFLKKKREGKKVKIALTPLGMIYAKGQSIRELKRNNLGN